MHGGAGTHCHLRKDYEGNQGALWTGGDGKQSEPRKSKWASKRLFHFVTPRSSVFMEEGGLPMEGFQVDLKLFLRGNR